MFALDDVYNVDFDDALVLKFIFVVLGSDRNTFLNLFRSIDQLPHATVDINDLVFMTFRYEITRDELNQVLGRPLLDNDLMRVNLPEVTTLTHLTPLRDIFQAYGLIDPFHKLQHAIFMAINNGSPLHVLKNNIEIDSGRNAPHYAQDLNEVFRSKWEANVARVMTYKGIEWAYEPQGFLLDSEYFTSRKKPNVYIPDFYIGDNTYLEVKGFWDMDSIMKVNTFMQQYQDHRLLIIDHDIYHDLQEVYSPMIVGWKPHPVSLHTEKVKVVGITRPERKHAVGLVKCGDQLVLKRERNPYDNNAIMVLDQNGSMLGYIGKEYAAIFAQKIDLGMKFTATVISKEHNTLTVGLKRQYDGTIIVHDILR
jgi:hypothetical protein